MMIHNLSVEDALGSLVTTVSGLPPGEAERRLHEYGKNEISQVRRIPLYRKFVAQFTHFLAVLLWVAAALCFVSDYLHPGEGMSSLGIAIVGVIVINAAFTFVQEYRAEKAVEALKKLLPYKVKALRGGAPAEVLSEEIVPGDVFTLEEGDRVPADARVIESDRLTVSNAPLTGESDALIRGPEPFPGEYLESPNLVFAGTLVVAGNGKAAAFATGMSTEFGKIAHLTGAVEPGLTPLQKEIKRLTRTVAVIAVTTGIVFFAVGLFTGRGFWHNFLFAVGIIIANVPEGLLPTVTLSLAMASQRMARKKALIKTLMSVETLGSVTVICTDKTGTLTQNVMEVKEAATAARAVGMSAGDGDLGMLYTAASLCTNASFENGRYRGDPTETALLKAAMESYGKVEARRVYDIPFDPERKRMTTVNFLDDRTLAFTKGAPEMVLPLCDRVLVGGDARPLGDGERGRIGQSCQAMMDRGLRVIGFAYKEIYATGPEAGYTEESLESSLVFLGMMGMEDPPRPEAEDAIRRCRAAGIRVIMLTGDASRTAVAIAKSVRLVDGEPLVIEGAALTAMPDDALKESLARGEVIFSRMTPRHKMRIVSVLKDEGERVAVTGDGVNDAPALKKADIGIAMGLSGTDVAREAADMVLLDDNFATIVNAVEEGRAIFENIRKFITYIFAHLTPEAVPYIMFAVFRIPLPLTVMQILAVDLGTETIPALALGVEPPEAGTMKAASKKGRGVIDRPLLVRSYLLLGLISSAAAVFAYFYVLYGGGWRWGETLPPDHPLARQASSATFLGIVVLQIGNVFACRSASESIFSLGFFSNRMIILGIAAELILAALIIYLPLGNKIFGTAPLSLDVWLVLVPFLAAVLLADELRKLFARRRRLKMDQHAPGPVFS
jgi:sodium/potassium-transporting ATPase subunit alpha